MSQPGAHAAVRRLHLLDRLVRRRRTARRHRLLHPQLAATNRWSATGPPARASCGPASASSCCWPASAPWSGGTPRRRPRSREGPIPATDPLGAWAATPSQRATLKYFWVVSALILVQILMGIVTAHYGVEGDGFYGIKISHILPYSVTRTWHVQIGIFWIATAWLAAGLFIGPLVSGKEPKFQALGVHVLFGALLVIVVGSLAGEWMSVQNKLSDANAFLWGHQGYEYVDLGRGWQILLFVGLLIWLFLVVRAMRPGAQGRRRAAQPALPLPALRRRHRPLLRRGPDLGPAHAPLHRRILALVGGPPLGGRLLRSLRHHRHRLLLHAPRPDPSGVRRQGRAALGHHLPLRRHHRHLPSPVLLRHADRRPGVGLGLQRAGSGAAHHGRLLRDGRPAQRPAGTVGAALQVGRSTSSSRWRSGTWSAPDCSAS